MVSRVSSRVHRLWSKSRRAYREYRDYHDALAKHDTEGDVGIINIITKKHSQRGLSGMVNLSGSTWLSRHVDFLLAQQHQRSRWYIGGQWTDRLRKSDFDQEKMTVVGDQTTTSHSVGPRTGNSYHYTMKGGWSLNLPKTTIALDLEGAMAEISVRER